MVVSAMGESKAGEGNQGALLSDCYFIWNSPGLTDKVTCELRPKRNRE